MNAFDLSVVATSRNDNHGESLLYRMQHFVNGFVTQCHKHQLRAELILVEWNPPGDTPPLSQVLQFPKELKSCVIRIICVPSNLHAQFSHADQIPLFQMIAKNVGIRRARGKFVLATNIDILFSDDLMIKIRKGLKSGRVYRVDRLDVPNELPTTSCFEEILIFCHTHFFRRNGKSGTRIKVDKKWIKEKQFYLRAHKTSHPSSIKKWLFKIKNNLDFLKDQIKKLRNKKITPSLIKQKSLSILYLLINKLNKKLGYLEDLYLQIMRHLIKRIRYPFLFTLHKNACGDFTLLSLEDWMAQKGYPEWPIHSWHIDSVFLLQISYNGMKQTIFSSPIFHIEHGKGSGYTPGEANHLFERLEKNQVPYLSNDQLLEITDQMRQAKKRNKKITYNDDQWGLANHNLEEITI